MDSFNPTTKAQQAISAAVQAAALAGNPDVGPTHLLGALLQTRRQCAPSSPSWATGCPRRRVPP